MHLSKCERVKKNFFFVSKKKSRGNKLILCKNHMNHMKKTNESCVSMINVTFVKKKKKNRTNHVKNESCKHYI